MTFVMMPIDSNQQASVNRTIDLITAFPALTPSGRLY